MAITERDEWEHLPSAARFWRESFYLNFHDLGGEIAGMSTVGVRPNQKRFEGFAVIYFRNQILIYRTEGLLDEATAGLFAVPGLTYELLTPLQACRFGASADFVYVDPRQTGQHSASPRTVPAGFDVKFSGLGPVHEYPPSYGQLAGDARHYEQNGHVEGSVTIEGQRFNINGLGCRDRTWGIRDLSMVDHGGAIFAQFGSHLTVNTLWGVSKERKTVVGYVSRAGEYAAIDDVRYTVESVPSTTLPSVMHAAIDTVGGQGLSVEGTIISPVPIVFTREGDRFLWYECFTRFQCGPEAGYGIFELARWI